ncbi:MAG TPA: MFS transporter [Bacteroidia bacterium]|nr:MFS transporter [Bacteroidia bacterium]
MQPHSEKSILLTLGIIQFTHVIDFMIIMPLGPQLMRIFEITPAQFGLLVSSYTFSSGLFGLLGAFFIDKFDRKKALLFFYLGFVVGTFACSLAPGYHMLLITRSLTGAFGGILGSLVLSVVGDTIPVSRRTAAMGVVMMGFSLASVLGVPAGLYFATNYGWHVPFRMLAILGLGVAFLIHKSLPVMQGHLSESSGLAYALRSVKKILSDANHLIALSLMFTLMMAQFFIVPYISTYMVANAGLKETDLPFIYLFGGLSTMVVLPWMGRLADRHGRLLLFTIFSILSMAVILVMTNISGTSLAVVLVVTTLFFSSVSGRGVAATTMITTAVHPPERGRFMSLNAAVQQLSAGLAAYFAGLIVYTNAEGKLVNFNLLGVMAVTTGVICIVLARKIVVRS